MPDGRELYLRVDLFDESMTVGPVSLEIPVPEDADPDSFAKGVYAGIEAVFKHYGVESFTGRINTHIPTEDED